MTYTAMSGTVSYTHLDVYKRQGQNMGAGNRERMIKSYRISLLYSFLAGAIFGGLLVVFGRQFLSLFASKPEVIEAGMERIKIMGFSYAPVSYTHLEL